MTALTLSANSDGVVHRYVCAPVEAIQLSHDNVRTVAEWLHPTDSGYHWYGDQPARFRTADGEIVASIGSWLVRIGASVAVVNNADFTNVFTASDGLASA